MHFQNNRATIQSSPEEHCTNEILFRRYINTRLSTRTERSNPEEDVKYFQETYRGLTVTFFDFVLGITQWEKSPKNSLEECGFC